MKRHPSLRSLSVDHHHGLVQAHRMMKSSALSIEEAKPTIAAFIAFAHEHLKTHFDEEEQILMPAVQPYISVEQDEQCQRMFGEHRRFWQLFDTLEQAFEAGSVSEEQAHEIGLLLEQHIRFEERELFPYIESLIPEEAMHRLGASLNS